MSLEHLLLSWYQPTLNLSQVEAEKGAAPEGTSAAAPAGGGGAGKRKAEEIIVDDDEEVEHIPKGCTGVPRS